MPIFMDLHKVPGIEAKHAAEAHKADLLIQEEFGCRCLTYWVDEERGYAFCLIDAPDAMSVRDMHESAHGLMPHEIIQVNSNVVEAFLGRIRDPEVEYDSPESAKAFCDPTFRVLVVCKTLDETLLHHQLGGEKADKLLKLYHRVVNENISQFEGRRIEYQSQEMVISFLSAFQALRFAHQLLEQMHFATDPLQLSLGVSAGLPVEQHKNIYGGTISTAFQLSSISKPHTVLCSPTVREIYRDDPPYIFSDGQLHFLQEKDKTALSNIFQVLEQNFNHNAFSVLDFAQRLSISKSALYRSCIQLFNRSPNELIKNYRLDKAISLLRAGSNVGETAFECGFTSTSYFSKLFYEHFSLQPSQFYKMASDNLNRD